MVSTGRVLLKGSLLRTLSFFVNVFTAFFLMPFTIKCLGDKFYGLWIFVISFTDLFGLFNLGLNSAIQRYVSRCLGRNDFDEANRHINTGVFLYSIIGGVAILVGAALACIVPIFVKNVSSVQLFQGVLIVLSINFAFRLVMSVFSGVLISHLRYDILTLFEIIRTILRTILIFLLLKNGFGIIGLTVVTVLVDALFCIATYYGAKHFAEYLHIGRKGVDFGLVKSLFGYSAYTFIGQIADKVRFNLDSFVITIFMGLSYVTIYSIAFRLVQYFIEFIATVIGVLTPVFSQYEGRGDYHSIREKFILSSKISSYVSLWIGGSLVIFGKPFIVLWMGEYYSQSYQILVILVIGITAALMQNPSVQVLYGVSKHRFYAISNSCEATANLILSIILVRRYGLMGVALGTTIPMMIIKLFVQPIFTCRAIGFDVVEYYLEVVIKPFLLAAIFISLFFQIGRHLISPSYLNLAVNGSLFGILLIAAACLFGFKKKERDYLGRLAFKMI